jgi:hypothetical protein
MAAAAAAAAAPDLMRHHNRKLLLLLICHAAAGEVLLGCCCCCWQGCQKLQLLLQTADEVLTMPHPKCPCQQGVRSSPQHCTWKAKQDKDELSTDHQRRQQTDRMLNAVNASKWKPSTAPPKDM